MYTTQTIQIRSHVGSYQVQSCISIDEALRIAYVPGKTWIISDALLSKLHVSSFNAILGTDTTERLLSITASEEAKSYEQLGPVFRWLLDHGFRRDCTLLAVGGGVIQDIASFVATVLLRGISWKFIPSTLLAQCDSCIGAKSSINIGPFKNQLGSFYPPTNILLVTDLLKSLNSDQIRSGFGEIIKFHLLDGQSSWEFIQDHIDWDDQELIRSLVLRSLAIKLPYIENDEFDRGVRNLLNYGHTFGHAFETATNFAIPHGIGVAIGMSAATYISEQRGLTSSGHFTEVNAVLKRVYTPFQNQLSSTNIDLVIKAMGTDKKNVAGSTFVILTRGPGKMEKIKVDLEAEIRPLLCKFFAFINM